MSPSVLPALAAALLATVSVVCASQTLTVVDPSVRYQRLSGYGQGSMDQRNVPWHSELSEDVRNELLDRLYTLQGDGLGWNVCRTYICAGDAAGHQHFSRRPGGGLAPLGYEPADGVFSWEGHEVSVWHARGAQARGATMVAFWNSPPHWMTVSGCTAGSENGKDSNLRPGLEGRFAEHIGAVLEHYRQAWGVDFDYVSPINEPEANWWTAKGGQDGCHVDATQARGIVAALAQVLRIRGLQTRIQAPEAAFAASHGYLDTLLADPVVAEALTTLTCHQYSANDQSLRGWAKRARAQGKELWMSEWGDWTHHGLDLAMNYAQKLRQAHRAMLVPVWCVWEPGFLLDTQGGKVQPNKAFYAVAQFTRHARPGMQVVEATDATCRTTAYLDDTARRFVLVSVNSSTEAVPMVYDLGAFTGLSAVSARRTSETEDYAPVAESSLKLQDDQQGRRLAIDLPARSITTITLTYSAVLPSLVADAGFEEDTGAWQFLGDGLSGIEDSYPQGGLCDGYLHPTTEAPARLWQTVRNLKPGARYRLTGACATSGIGAEFGVESGQTRTWALAQGGAYRLYDVCFRAGEDGTATISYAAPAATSKDSWATIDNVALRPIEAAGVP
jgi:O-glycosyl hydrolase